MSFPPLHIVEPQPERLHSHTIILLHGRSSTASQFASEILSLNSGGHSSTLLSYFPSVRWVFPDGGERWCSAFQGIGSAWFDTFSLQDLTERQNDQLPGLRDGIKHVKEIVEKEVQRLNGNSHKVFLGGFSQGSSVAMWSLFTGAATTTGRLGGFVGLSAWMPFTKEVTQTVTASTESEPLTGKVGDLTEKFLGIVGMDRFGAGTAQLSGMPVFLGHGVDDILISVQNCHDLTSIFRGLHCDVEAHEYLGAERDGHWVKEPEEVSDLVDYLKKHMQKE
jgi:predicted esterase